MWPPRDPLLLPACCFGAGILAAAHSFFDSYELVAAAVAFALLLAAALRRARRAVPVVLAGLFLLVGAAVFEYHRPPPAPELNVEDGEIAILGGCVVEPISSEPEMLRFVLELEPGARVRVTVNARPDEQLPAVHYGKRVDVQARIRKPRNFKNPGTFDYARHLRRQDIHWTASARGVASLEVLPGTCGNPVRAATFAVREYFIGELRQLYADDTYTSRLAPALLVGDNSGLERNWTEDFRRTGTYHAIVISGLHITVVCGFALFLLRVVGMPLGWTLMLSSVLAWGYAAVALFQPPVVRSAAGFTIFLVARWWFRRVRLLNLLAVTAIGFLAFDPEQIFEASFQLTFLAVAAIGSIAAPLHERWLGSFRPAAHGLNATARDSQLQPAAAQLRIELRLLAQTVELYTRIPARLSLLGIGFVLRLAFWLAEMVIVSASVQLFLGLLMVVYFHQFSVTSILANVFVVPPLTLAVPVGFVAALTGWGWIAAITQGMIRFAAAAAGWWMSLEPGWRIPDPPAWAALGFAASICLLAVLAFRGARMRFVVAAAACTAAACAALLVFPFAPLVPEKQLELTAIDVGQGESLLVAFPNAQLMLVDGGGIPVFDPRRKPRLEIGEDVVSPYLWQRRINRLDIVAVTHLHDDHVGGLPAVIRNFRPREVWTGAVADSPGWQQLRQAAAETGARIVQVASPATMRIGDVEVQALAPSADYMPRSRPENDDSLVLTLTYGQRRFLLTGDIGGKVEEELIAAGTLDDVDVLKVAHHGSRFSTSTAFLDAVQPLFAVISAGHGNLYGHPNPAVIDRLYRMGTRIYRTDVNGRTTFRTDGRRLEVEWGSGDSARPAFGEKLSN